MKRPLVLHIGTTKTGSTSIQHVLSESRASLAAQGVCYPRSPGAVQHAMLARAMMNDPTQGETHDANWLGAMTADERIALFKREFDAEMAALPPSITRVILSSEFIYIHLHKAEEVQRLHDFLVPYFDPIQVVVYLRRQDAHLTSLYTQILRTGAVLPPEQLKMRARPKHELDYAVLLNRWARIFGKANIVPRLFERSAAKRFDSVEDFCSFCGISPAADGAPVVRESNQSMSLAGQRLLIDMGERIQAQRKVENVNSQLWRVLTDTITKASPGRGWQPVRAKAEAMYAEFRESNAEVCEQWFPGRATLFNEDFSEYPEDPPVASPEAIHEAACNIIMLMAEREVQREFEFATVAVTNAQKSGKPKRLRTALKRAIWLDSNNAEMRIMLAQLMIEDNRLDAARDLLNEALQIAPGDAAAQALMAELVQLESDPARAVANKPNKRRRGRAKQR